MTTALKYFFVCFLLYILATLMLVTGFSLYAVWEATAYYFEIIKMKGV